MLSPLPQQDSSAAGHQGRDSPHDRWACTAPAVACRFPRIEPAPRSPLTAELPSDAPAALQYSLCESQIAPLLQLLLRASGWPPKLRPELLKGPPRLPLR